MDPVLETQTLCFYSYLSRQQFSDTFVDGILVAMMSAYLKRNITLISPNFTWSADEGSWDIVIGYLGDNIFVQTQVGKYELYFLTINDQYRTLSKSILPNFVHFPV